MPAQGRLVIQLSVVEQGLSPDCLPPTPTLCYLKHSDIETCSARSRTA